MPAHGHVQQWLRVNDDIETVDAGEAGWGKSVADFTEDLAVRLPEAFWVDVLLFEFVGDNFNQAMRNDPDLARAADGRLLHPILVQIGRAHTSEEARQIAYARRWLTEGMSGLSDEEVFEVQSLAQLGAQSLIDRKAFLPVKWTDQLEPYLTKDELKRPGVSPRPHG